MNYSHQLTYILYCDSIEEINLKFYGSNLEMQELELVLSSSFPAQNTYQQEILSLVNGLTAAYTGKMEYTIEIGYNQNLLKGEKEEGKEEEHYEL